MLWMSDEYDNMTTVQMELHTPDAYLPLLQVDVLSMRFVKNQGSLSKKTRPRYAQGLLQGALLPTADETGVWRPRVPQW